MVTAEQLLEMLPKVGVILIVGRVGPPPPPQVGQPPPLVLPLLLLGTVALTVTVPLEVSAHTITAAAPIIRNAKTKANSHDFKLFLIVMSFCRMPNYYQCLIFNLIFRRARPIIKALTAKIKPAKIISVRHGQTQKTTGAETDRWRLAP